MPERVIVLGAGLAGLSAAHLLEGHCVVFEKENAVGGHSRSHAVGGFLFDEGAHVFFGKGACADRFVLQPLGEEFAPQRAEIWNNYGEQRYGRYPVQVNAHALPPELATRCVLDFIAAAQQPGHPVRTYEEWCRASFGTTLSEEFMLRYARKIWTVEPSELNTDWLGSSAGGRISRPSLEQVVRGAVDSNPQALNYLTEFAYPKSGGFGRIVEPLAAGVRNIRLGCAVKRIEAIARRITFADGSVRSYDAAITTIPLPALVRLIEDAPGDVRSAARRLRCTSVRCVNLGIARADIGPGHWCYFYDSEIPFFRISFPAKLSRGNAPAGCGSIQCEIAYSQAKSLNEVNLIPRVVDALRRTGILRDGRRDPRRGSERHSLRLRHFRFRAC